MTARHRHGPLPLLVAVTGHRDLVPEDEPRLRQQVSEIFQKLALRFSWTPLRVLSGLAEGADRLVARVALEKELELVACLPMERALYEADFRKEQSRQEFRELLSRAKEVISLPLVGGNTEKDVSKEGPARDAQYAALGHYLVAQGQVLIALWDGNETSRPGGTASIVHQRLGQADGELKTDLPHLLDNLETGPVYHVPTRRMSIPSAYSSLGNWRVLDPPASPDRLPAETRQQVYASIDCLNRDVVLSFRRLTAERRESKNAFLPPAIQQTLAGSPLEELIDHYATADSLALDYRKRTRQSFRALIFFCGLGGLFLFELFGHGPAWLRGPALLLYLLVITLAYAWYRAANVHQLKRRYLDYRALAEGIRVQIFWTIARLPERVADHYLSKQKTELDWIRQAIRSWSITASDFIGAADWALVREFWVEKQRNFFQAAAEKNWRRHRLERQWTRRLLFSLVAIATAVAAALLHQWISRGGVFPFLPAWFRSDVFRGLEIHGLLVIVMSMLPAIAGALAAYSLKMAVSEQRRQYERMYLLYHRAGERLSHALQRQDETAARRIVTALGEEALTENGDWVLLHRERKIDMPFT